MRHLRSYIILILILFFSCKKEIQPDLETLHAIIDSKDFSVTITGCHGSIVGKNYCYDEFLYVDSSSITYINGDKKYIRLLSDDRWDSLYFHLHSLLKFHQPDKNLKKDGFGCTYHDYDYTFENDTLKTTIKPREGNGIYYSIQDLMNVEYYNKAFSGLVYFKILDSIDFKKLLGHEIIDANVLYFDGKYNQAIRGLNLLTTLFDTTITILATPNPGLSIKRLAPYMFYQPFDDFKEFEILPERSIFPFAEIKDSEIDLTGLRILDIKLSPKMGDTEKENDNKYLYKISHKDRYELTITFYNESQLVIDNNGDELIINYLQHTI